MKHANVKHRQRQALGKGTVHSAQPVKHRNRRLHGNIHMEFGIDIGIDIGEHIEQKEGDLKLSNE